MIPPVAPALAEDIYEIDHWGEEARRRMACLVIRYMRERSGGIGRKMIGRNLSRTESCVAGSCGVGGCGGGGSAFRSG